jgi:hypothetical protein
MKMTSTPIQVSTRVINAKWTVEMCSDLKSHFGFSLEEEVRSKMRAEFRILKIKNIFKDDN